MTDYSIPVQQGKPIVIGQAAILWGDEFTHSERGYVAGGWILPGCVRTTNGEYASRVCRELNDSIKAMKRAKPNPFPEEPEDIGEMIVRHLRKIL